MLSEKPGVEDYMKLDVMKVPFYLNLVQCQLLMEDYYPVSEHTTEVLKRKPGMKNMHSIFDTPGFPYSFYWFIQSIDINGSGFIAIWFFSVC